MSESYEIARAKTFLASGHFESAENNHRLMISEHGSVTSFISFSTELGIISSYINLYLTWIEIPLMK